MYICNFQTLIYKELGTLNAFTNSLQTHFLLYFLWNQWSLLNTQDLSLFLWQSKMQIKIMSINQEKYIGLVWSVKDNHRK